MAPRAKRGYYSDHESGLCASSRTCLSYLCQKILGTAIGAGLFIFLAWLILQPRRPKLYVDYVSLSQLNVSDRILNCRMDFNITVRNPNARMGIYYHKLQWDVSYEDERIASADMPPFHQRHKTTTVLQPVLVGHEYAIMREDVARALETLETPLELRLKLHTNVRFKIGLCKTWNFKMKVECRHIYIAHKFAEQRFVIRATDNHVDGDDSLNKRTRCKVHL